MSPLRESFGEEWVDMDEEEEEVETGKDKGEALVEAKVDRIGGFSTRKESTKKQDIICKGASLESLSQVHMGSSFEIKEENPTTKDNFLVEMEFEISEVSKSKGQIEGNWLELMGKPCLKHGNEHHLEVECLKHDMQERSPLNEPCLGWPSDAEKRVPMLKRVTSEASFMRGQVMVSKSESIQVVMSKRESSKEKEGSFSEDWGNEETKRREVEVVLNKNESNEKTRDKGKRDGSEEVGGAHQVPSLVCVMPLEPVHMRPCTSVPMHPMVSKAVCTESKAWKDSKTLPMSKGSKTLKEVSAALEAHPEVTSKAHMVSVETQMHSKTEEAAVKAKLEDAHMPVEKLKSAQMHNKTVEAVADCHVKDLEEAQMQIIKSKAHSKVKTAGSRRVKPLEVLHMGEKSPHCQREQGEGVGKQVSGGQLEVKEVECECCGMGEECSIGYIEHVKGVFSGHWVCGLCAEAVHEERHRLGRGVPMEEAVRTHMNFCKQFSSKKKAGEPSHGIGVAHAVCHLLSRHLSDPTSPRHITPGARPVLSRTSSCLPSLSHSTP